MFAQGHSFELILLCDDKRKLISFVKEELKLMEVVGGDQRRNEIAINPKEQTRNLRTLRIQYKRFGHTPLIWFDIAFGCMKLLTRVSD